jgi:hypothetical protein
MTTAEKDAALNRAHEAAARDALAEAERIAAARCSPRKHRVLETAVSGYSKLAPSPTGGLRVVIYSCE